MNEENSGQKFYGLYDVLLGSFKVGFASDDYSYLCTVSTEFVRSLIINEGYEEDVEGLSAQEVLDYYDFQIKEVTKSGFEKILYYPDSWSRVNLNSSQYN